MPRPPLTLRRLAAFGALAVSAFVATPSAHAGPVETTLAGLDDSAPRVKSTLLADRASVAPGESFTLGLVLDHPAHWHTYWKNPGEAGTLTSLEWKETSGTTFGEWVFPSPVLLDQAGIRMFVFEGRAVILIPAKAPVSLKPGDTLKLSGRADWLECDDKGCHPQGADLEISLPVAASGSPANNELFATALAATPETDGVGAATLSAEPDDRVKLTLSREALAGRDAGSARFFPLSEELPATYAEVKPGARPDGAIEWTFPEKAKVASLKKLEGVVTFARGRPLAISATLEATPAPAIAGTTATRADSAPVTPTATPGEGEAHGLPALLALAFGGGILLNIMPCVFPVLGLKIYGFVNKAHSDRRKVVSHALVFASGIVVSFWMLAGVIIGLKSGASSLLGLSGTDIGWGFLLQIPGFVAAIAVLFLVMGLSLAGLFEFGTGVQNAAGAVEDKGGYAGSFLSGVLATLVATPCSGPGIAPALGAAFAAPPIEAFAIFTALALGLASPFVVLAASPGLLKKLPRPGPWMESFKQGMAFLLFATLAYFVWILSAQLEEQRLLFTLFAFVAIAAACWVFGRWAAPHREPGVRRAGKTVAALLFLGGCATIATQLPATPSATSAESGPKEIVWEAWSPEAEARHLAAGETVYVDFTARWCATCQVNKRVFHDASVVKAFATHKVVALKADWTNKSGVITKELAKYHRSAIPFNVLLRPGAEARPLPEVLTASAVLEALSR